MPLVKKLMRAMLTLRDFKKFGLCKPVSQKTYLCYVSICCNNCSLNTEPLDKYSLKFIDCKKVISTKVT